MGRFQGQSRGFHLAVLVVLIGAAVTAFLGVLDVYDMLSGSAKTVTELLTSCPYSAMTGTACPLCGTVRALALLVRGNIEASLSANPLAAALLPMGLVQLAYRCVRVARPVFQWKEEVVLISVGMLPVLALM